MDGEVFVSVQEISKSFGLNLVLKQVSLDIRAGEILVLLGPNGAGKSTLLNIVGGTLSPTLGKLSVGGASVNPASWGAGEARRAGIQRVFQELSTFPNLTVAENIALTSDQPLGRRAMVERAQERMQAFERSRIDVMRELADLSIAERQMVEIARAMTEPGTRLVILDEPTSALSSEEADQLIALVERKASEGVAVIYVTHKLEEALRLAHRIVVLRDGRLHFDGDGRSATHDQLLTLLGASPADTPQVAASPVGTGEDLLRLEALTSRGLHQVSLRVGAGEVIGIAGLEGAGQRDLLQAIFAGRGRETPTLRSTSDIAYVSGDRKREGLLPLWSVGQNVAISAAAGHARAGVVAFAELGRTALRWLDDLGLGGRAADPITALSGGNQQKALLARALASEATLLLLDDPTRGVDVGAKAAIHDLLGKVKGQGRSVVLYSTEVAEFRKCDRVYVMARGRIVAEFSGSEATEDRIIAASFLRPEAGEGGPTRAAGQGAPSVLSTRALPAAILLLAMCLTAWLQQPRVLSPFGLELLLQASVPLTLAVLAQMFFILGGDIDLGLGFAIGLANVVAATFLPGDPLLGILGLLSIIGGYVLLAVIVEVLGVSSVVATLGASFVWLGLGLMLRETPGGLAPEWLAGLAKLKLWPLPLAFYMIVGIGLAGLWLTQGWSYGLRLRALGHNARIYRSMGYSALAGRVTLYGLSGVFAVLAGLWITGATGSGNINVAASFTLSTVAAVIVGGASFAGGVVSALGAVMAVVGISMITTNLVLMGASAEYSTALGGIVLILALSFRAMGLKRS